MLTVPLTEDDSPNVFVSVLLTRGRIADKLDENGLDLGKPTIRLGYTELKVPAKRDLLTVDVTPNVAETGPGGEIEVTVAVRDAKGQPMREAEVAIIAADAGADAVLVSNHGGRVLDHTPGTAEALPAIADAVGKRVVVMLDGGIRSGADVLKALALGAHMTLICRPVMIAIHGDEENGLATYYAHIREELIQAMRLTGCADVASVTNRILC